ncbi:hypothetical protein B0O99DRAFT_689765 [Bisporella sp. PMI_857]|nr:hypothetical protein B0O99DRAFT_689765 [Bisporella sp. PMI_857]
MQFSTTVLAALFVSSTVFASALPELQDRDALAMPAGPELGDSASGGNDAGISDNEGGVEPQFDPQELTQDESTVKVEGRSIYEAAEDSEEGHIEARGGAGSKIVSCAYSYKGTKYLYGGCKATAPFGPAKGGMDCSCLSRTCVKKGTGTTIPRTTTTQYATKAGKCRKVARKSALPGDLIFWGCSGSSTSGIHHVGIYSKKGYVTHAPHTGTTVREEKIWTKAICPSVVRCW